MKEGTKMAKGKKGLVLEVGDIVTTKGQKRKYRVTAVTDANAVVVDSKGQESLFCVKDLTFFFPLEIGKKYFFMPKSGHFGIHIVTGMKEKTFTVSGGNGEHGNRGALRLNQFTDIILVKGENLIL